MLVGYARVATTEQQLALQTDARDKAGGDKRYQDTVSGSRADRPGLRDRLDCVRDGDTVVVWTRDRFGRSL